jgi:hypothetical protein
MLRPAATDLEQATGTGRLGSETTLPPGACRPVTNHNGGSRPRRHPLHAPGRAALQTDEMDESE